MSQSTKPRARKGTRSLGHYGHGTNAAWYEGWDLTEEERAVFRERSKTSREAKRKSISGEGTAPVHEIYTPRLEPDALMPQRGRNGLKTLSLFSGGGGLDLGFDRAGFEHVASFEMLSDAARTLSDNRPDWSVYSGDAGDVTGADWTKYRGVVDVVHGGPPCQPFSAAGRQRGHEDERNLFPAFIKAVKEIRPRAFVAENVRALAGRKFKSFVDEYVIGPVAEDYNASIFELSAASFGVPQVRHRVFVVGIRKDSQVTNVVPPAPTHSTGHLQAKETDNEHGGPMSFDKCPPHLLQKCMGAREALGLPDVGYDALAPTLRSGLTGPRHTTSILSSVSALKKWGLLGVWPNGVAKSRDAARLFVPANGHYRLSVKDCAVLQGFPENWRFHGAVYMVIGQIGNSVAPPVAYHVAESVSRALSSAA